MFPNFRKTNSIIFNYYISVHIFKKIFLWFFSKCVSLFHGVCFLQFCFYFFCLFHCFKLLIIWYFSDCLVTRIFGCQFCCLSCCLYSVLFPYVSPYCRWISPLESFGPYGTILHLFPLESRDFKLDQSCF